MKFDKILGLAKKNIVIINIDNKKQYVKVLNESFKRNIRWGSGDTNYDYEPHIKSFDFRIWDDDEEISISYSKTHYLYNIHYEDKYKKINVYVFEFNQIEFDSEELE